MALPTGSGGQGLAIVTGGSRGIGAAICRRLAQAGHSVAVVYATGAEPAQAVVAAIRAAGGQAEAYACDVGNGADVERMFVAAEQALGKLAVLVSNAGVIGPRGRVVDADAGEIAGLLATNVAGPILCAQAAIRRLSTRHGGQGGAIVNISSIAPRLGGAGEIVAYAASKGAVDAFTLGLAREVAGEGIRVNAVAPGLIETRMNPGERLARLVPNVPAGRVGQPEEVAEAVAFLASPAASYIVGAVLEVGGGR